MAMKSVYLILALILLGALVLPFFMQGPDGKPLMNVNQVLVDNTPDLGGSTEIYRWQDEHGVWQFGEAPDAQDAQLMSVEANYTPMGSEWDMSGVVGASAGKSTPKVPTNVLSAYGNVDKIVGDAKNAAKMIEEHNERLEQVYDKTR